MKELYTVHPPRLAPIDVWAHDAAEAQHLAAAWWQYSGDVSGLTVDYHPQNDEAALAGATAQDGKEKVNQCQNTTVSVRGQHECERCNPEDCLCMTCKRGCVDARTGRCCTTYFSDSEQFTVCPDYLPEEAPPC